MVSKFISATGLNLSDIMYCSMLRLNWRAAGRLSKSEASSALQTGIFPVPAFAEFAAGEPVVKQMNHRTMMQHEIV
jgi:hypothetical protein